MRERGPSFVVFTIAVSALVAVIVLLPVAAAAFASIHADGVFTLAAYKKLLSESNSFFLLRNTLAVALGAAAVATALGMPAGWVLERWRPPGANAFKYLLAVPFLIPNYVMAMAWIDLLGVGGILTPNPNPAFQPNIVSMGGLVVVLGMSCYPVVLFATVTALRRLDYRLEEAALVQRPPRTAVVSVVLPLAAPVMLAGVLTVFLLTLPEYTVPSLLQVNTYPVAINTDFTAFFDVPAATAKSLPLVFTGFIAIGLWWLLLSPSHSWLRGESHRHRPIHLAQFTRWMGSIFLAALLSITVAMPLFSLMHRAASLTYFLDAWNTAWEETLTSLLLATVSATLICFLAFSMAWITRNSPRGRGIFALCAIPFLVSGPIIGIGLIKVWNHAGPSAMIYDSIVVLVFALTARYLFLAWLPLRASLATLDAGLLDACRVHAVPWWRQLVFVAMPLCAPTLVAVWALAFILGMREVDATVLATPPGITPLPIRIHTLMHFGPSQLVASLCLSITFLLLMCAAFGLAASNWLRGRLHG